VEGVGDRLGRNAIDNGTADRVRHRIINLSGQPGDPLEIDGAGCSAP
jgi:hypothetical protein